MVAPLPAAPRPGMTIWVQTQEHWSIGVHYSVSRVNSRSFYVSTSGRVERYLLVEWDQWLAKRLTEGAVTIDNSPVSTELPSSPGTSLALLREARELQKSYRVETITSTDDEVVFSVRGPDQDRRVSVDPQWRRPPRCSCGASSCRSSFIALLSREDLRAQLLDVIL